MPHSEKDFYSDRKWCPCCDTYVSYLMSLDTSFCVECGGEVRLFSKEDWLAFSETMQARRPKGGRRARAKNAGIKSESPRRSA